jgi:hypothetical protein
VNEGNHLAGACGAAAGHGGAGDGEPGASRQRAQELRGGGAGASAPEKNELAAGLRGKVGAAEDRRRRSSEEGGAARRPRAAVADGPAGGGCGGGVNLECGDSVASFVLASGGASLLFVLVSGEAGCWFISSSFSFSYPFQQLRPWAWSPVK